MENQQLRTTDYFGTFQYLDESLDFVHRPEGYVKAVHTGNTTEYHYVYHYTDHTSTTLSTGLGNIRLSYGLDPETNEVAILKESHYYPFGLQHQGYVGTHKTIGFEMGTSKVELIPVRNYLDDIYRYAFNAKEHQPELGLNWHDYHARNYDAALGRWMNVDPLGEKMPSWSPYNYAFNNPVIFTDPTGMAPEWIEVTKNKDGTFKVENGVPNSDKNVYVVDDKGNRTGEVLGEMLTEYSFFSDNGTVINNATIDLSDQSGQNFFNDEIINVGLFEYMDNAEGGEPLDFKTNDMPERLTLEEESRYHYRGMSFNGKIASARDVGNYAAGYVARKHGFGWSSSRFAFDALETKQAKGIWNTILFYPFNRIREGQPTQRAQRAGHNGGYPIFKQKQDERQFNKATNPWPIGPKY